jgi:integrase
MSSRRGKNEGSIHHRKDGRWVGVIDLGWQQGRRVRKYVYGRTRSDARDRLKEAQRRLDAGLAVLDDRQPLSVFLQNWLDEVVTPSVRPRTLDSYRHIVDHHLVPALGHVPLADLTPRHVHGLISAKVEGALSPRTVEYIWQVLRRSLKVAVVWGLLTRNVA